MYNDVHNRVQAMKEVPFTEFRRNAASLLDAVERGERIRVLRHGRPVAEVVPVARPRTVLSWKKPGLLLEADGALLSREILAERKRGRG
ncbi:MAG: type II toxin-antitoxin system Phd/YefM family antitoxin [Candidatus Aminicenantales bacterium]